VIDGPFLGAKNNQGKDERRDRVRLSSNQCVYFSISPKKILGFDPSFYRMELNTM
jgi:hypothetical protein